MSRSETMRARRAVYAATGRCKGCGRLREDQRFARCSTCRASNADYLRRRREADRAGEPVELKPKLARSERERVEVLLEVQREWRRILFESPSETFSDWLGDAIDRARAAAIVRRASCRRGAVSGPDAGAGADGAETASVGLLDGSNRESDRDGERLGGAE